MTYDFRDYAESLYSAKNFDEAFHVLEREIQRLGFEAVLYTYIPGSLVQSDISAKPHYQVSDHYAPKYLTHYEDARFDRDDPLIKMVVDGVKKPIDWAGDHLKSYTKDTPKSSEVIDVARGYGIENGLTIPLLCGDRGIAGASLINGDKGGFNSLLNETMPQAQTAITMYHNLVVADPGYLGNFVKPLFSSLNDLEMRYLAGLSLGKSQAAMAIELSRSIKYLEQVMLRIRRKVSGVDAFDKPVINRNQLFYYAGLVNIIRQVEGH